ncbi:MAG: serine/threonine protein kinase, partial [Deltaproteobacteria bacterium]|nr:serine/threonine protein kinase [Deltaproteobacteria bacterium]
MTSAIEEVPAGTMIAGRFRVEALLGSGGMADVYRAIDAATGTPLALKLIRPVSGARGAEVEDRVRREGEILRVLAHPAIVRIETFGRTDDGLFFIAMELLEGETLGDVMRRGRLSPGELVPIVAGTCAGLAAAHDKGIVHRDLKPDNIFLTQDGGALQVKLLDFGIARLDDAAKKITKTGEILGTPRYMAPELLSAERNLDGRTDTYALGVILFEALAGKPPYLAANPTDLIVAILHAKHPPLGSVCRGLPPAVEAVVARAMARAREARYATA